jgi:membrane protein DedA with SNARE-associated domain
MSDGTTGRLTNSVEEVIDTLGYVGVALLVMGENVFPPIPSEVVLPGAGLYAERNGGAAAVIGMVIAATIGSVVGAWILYGVAAAIGPERLRRFVVLRGRWFGLKEMDLDKAERWFDKRDDVAVLVCRCVPLVRSLVSIPAGFRRMPALRFTLYTALGSALWNTALIMVGYAASSRQDDVEAVIGYVQYVVLALILAAVGWFVWRRIVRGRVIPPPAPPDHVDHVDHVD